MIRLKTPTAPIDLPSLFLVDAQRIAPWLARGCSFAEVVERPIEQATLPGVIEPPTIEAPVATKRPRYQTDADRDLPLLLDTLRASGAARSSGDLEAATGIPSSVVRRLLVDAVGKVEMSGTGRGTKYRLREGAKTAAPALHDGDADGDGGSEGAGLELATAAGEAS